MDKSNLESLECPQNWGFDKFPDLEERLNRHNKGELHESEECDDDTKYGAQVDKFILFYLKSFEAYRKKNYSEALQFLETADTSDAFMDKYKKVFKHVILASKAHILFATESFAEAKKICSELKDEFSDVDKAAIKYIKCRLQLKYGEAGAVDCIELIKDAIKIVPGEAEFLFVLGHALGRIRHFTYPPKLPGAMELDALEKAYSLRKDSAKYAITLARSYMDNKYENNYRKKEFIFKATSTYKTLLKYHESLSGNDISRCVYHLTKSSFDPDLEEYARIAKKKSDSVLTNHYCGIFYINNEQYEEALECFEKTVEHLPFIASLVLLSIYRVNKNSIDVSEIASRVTEWTDYYSSPDIAVNNKVEFHLVLSQFYLVVMNDLKSASIQFLEAAKLGIKEKSFINVSKKRGYINYLVVLNNELSKCNKNDGIIIEATRIIKTLPEEITTDNSRSAPSLFDLKANLY